jgi:hypothetical protein
MGMGVAVAEGRASEDATAVPDGAGVGEGPGEIVQIIASPIAVAMAAKAPAIT